MKVLKEGPGWNIEQTCTGKGNGDGGCGAVLLVEKDDIYMTWHTYLAGDTDYYYTFTCPCCDVKTDIPEEELPLTVRNLAYDKMLALRNSNS